MPTPVYYCNRIDAHIGDNEIILTCKLKSGGKPAEVCKVILPHDIAVKLSLLLAPPEERESSDEPDNS